MATQKQARAVKQALVRNLNMASESVEVAIGMDERGELTVSVSISRNSNHVIQLKIGDVPLLIKFTDAVLPEPVT